MLCSQQCTTEELASPCPQFPLRDTRRQQKSLPMTLTLGPHDNKTIYINNTVILNVSARLIVICILSDLLMGKIKKLGLNILNNYEFSNKRTHLRLTPNYSTFFFFLVS